MSESYRAPGQPYSGAPIFTARSADGTLFAVFAGRRVAGGVFSQQVARLVNNVWRWYEVPNASTPRPSMSIEATGLFVTYLSEDSKVLRRWKVPDFVTPGNTPTPPQPADCVDQTARDGVAALKAQASQQQMQINTLRSDVAALQAAPPSGVTVQQVEDIVWARTPDAVYYDLQNEGGIYGQIQAIVDKALKDRGL